MSTKLPSSNEPNIAAMLRHIVTLKIQAGEREFSFTELQMLIEAARLQYEEHGVTRTEDELDDDARVFRDQYNGLLRLKMKSPYIAPTIKRHVAKAGFDCAISLSRDEDDEILVSVTLSDEPIEKPARTRKAKAVPVVQADSVQSGEHIDTVRFNALALWVPDFTKYDDEELSTARQLLEEFRNHAEALRGKSEEVAE
ncbi:hypothetical protein [Citrobacter phage IME-JL8]|uniref:Uncharacterized protein n=1 Tax=Citrobacter phage IME-JL8 TaxID=2709754 RepID=A0A6G6XTC3_9CAUD|nr:hypothetical protein [Citrobacter phage IME-JL8]